MEDGIGDTRGIGESRRCNACGGRIEAGAQFCSACGHRVRPAGTDTSFTASAADPASVSRTGEAVRQRLVATPKRVMFRWILASSLALGLGSVGPWATASVLGITVSVSGLHGGGWVTLVVACAAILLLLDPDWLERAAWLRERRLGTMMALAILASVICVLNFVDAESSGLEGIVHPGWGLYLSAVASVGLTVWAWAARAQHRGALPDSR
jgi:hypothetical protein